MIVSVVLVVMILMMCEEDVSNRHSRGGGADAENVSHQ